jgi:hypothetical protein
MICAALDRGVEGSGFFRGNNPMRRLGALLLVCGLATPACFAGTGETEQPADNSVPWYRRVFLGEREKPVPAKETPTAARTGAGSETPRATPVVNSREAAKKQLAEETRIYLERLQAISRIRKIATDQGDEALLQKADDLEAQAEELFKLRTAMLPKLGEGGDDRAALERGRDERPASAARPSPSQRRPSMRGTDR